MKSLSVVNHHRCRQRNFTLIEMLVVIAIIGILASMLAPSLSNSLALAKNIECTNNLSKMGVAWYQYSEDYGRFPVKTDQPENDYNLRYWRMINPYYGKQLSSTDYSSYRCPVESSTNYSYGANAYILQKQLTGTPWIEARTRGLNFSSIQKPSYKVLMADSKPSWSSVNRGTADDPTTQGVSCRHQDDSAANYVFFDGHTQSQDYFWIMSNVKLNWYIY